MYIKSPINYFGNKYKLLNQLYQHFPKDVDTFVDLFGGSFTVGANYNSNKTIYNDNNEYLVELIKWLYEIEDVEKEIKKIESIIEKWQLNDKNLVKENFYEFRKYYNENRNIELLYILICFSFNGLMRFNSKGEYNTPFGNRKFNNVIKNNFINFVKIIKNKNIEFYNSNFDFVLSLNLNENDFIYCDPPYLITTDVMSYNSKNWDLQDEYNLYDVLNKLNNNHVKWALSNVSIYRNKENNILLNWVKEHNYRIIEIDYKYNKNNLFKKDNDKLKSQEILVVNY